MKSKYGAAAARAAAAAIRRRVRETPRVGVILGSGLGGLANQVQQPRRLAYRAVPGFPRTTVPGHSGEVVGGRLDGVPIVAFSGRFHMYEGHDAALAAFPARVAAALGADTLIISNAAGALKRTLEPGTLVLITDHINLTGRNPLVGPVEPGDERFPDMSSPYDADLRRTARRVGGEFGVALVDGVYAGVLGPSYETAAEVRMLAALGADVVGMSTVPEVIAARAVGLRVLGVSCVTNLATGLSDARVTHEDVLAATARAAGQLERLVRGVVAAL